MVDFSLKNKDECPICNFKMKKQESSSDEMIWCNSYYSSSMIWKNYHYQGFVFGKGNRSEMRIIEICYKLSPSKEHLEVNLYYDILGNKVGIRWFDYSEGRKLLYTLAVPKLLPVDFPELSCLKKQVDNYFNLLIFS